MNLFQKPVITGDFNPKFYWTGDSFVDAESINRPHIKSEGAKEDRIIQTIDILSDLSGWTSFTLEDALNIQNRLLKTNNWKGIRSGLRTHNVSIKKTDGSFEQTPQFIQVRQLIEQMFPVSTMPKEHLLEWYRQVQMIHPLSDLNGRVFGIIVSVLHKHNIK